MATKPTDAQIRQALPRAKAYRLALGEGVCLAVMPDGGKFWRLRYRFGGKEKMLSLGAYAPDTLKHVSLKDALHAASAARALLRRGVDPSEDRREKKLALRLSVARTFGDAANKWAEHNAPRWRPATREKVDQYLRKDLLPTLGKRPLASITPLELGQVVERIEARNALNVAKKTRQWLGRIFEYAIAKGLTTSNPAEYLGAVALPEPPSENHAHLSLAELPAFLRALDAYTGSTLTKGATWLALWTANRPGVTRTLRWAELDLAEGLWTIPKGRDGMKRGYSHITPLPRQAVALLRELHPMTGTFEYVFIGRNDPRAPMSDGAVNGMLKTIGYGGRQTAHGFRHLVSTALNERGYKADWIERQLAHGDPDEIRDTYNKALYLADRRKMMQAWADYLDEIKEGGAVLPFRKKAARPR
jgi:integrase